MIKRHRIVALCLALLMVAGLLAACGTPAASTSPSAPASEAPASATPVPASQAPASATPVPASEVPASSTPAEVVTIDIMIMNPQWKMRGYGDDPGTKQMLDKTGVALNFLVPSGDATEKATAMLAASDYPEVMQLGRGVAHDKYIAAGAWHAYNDLWDQYGNTTMKQVYPELTYKVNLQADGKLYSALNWFSEDGFGNSGEDINVRSDVWKALGEPEWTNISEYIDACKDLKTRAAEFSLNGAPFAPMHMYWDANNPSGWVERIGNAHGGRLKAHKYFDKDANAVQFALRSPEFVMALKWLNMCYNEGILDPEMFTFTNDTRLEARNQGRFAFDWTAFWDLRQASSTLKLIDPELTFIAIETPEFVEGVRPMLNGFETAGGPAFEITKNCKNPEAALRFADYYLSDEGNICSFYGAEGETMIFEGGDKTKPRLMPGVYEKKMEAWDEYGWETGVRKLDFMQNQKWNWERTQEPPDHMAYRNMAMAQSFDATMLNVITLDAESEAGRAWSSIQPTLAAEYTTIVTQTAPDKIDEAVATLLAKVEQQGIATVEATWTEIYNELNSR